jgi:hypothetical protein
MIEVPVSWGEVIDKITILEIKAARMGDPDKVANVRKELDLLEGRLTAAARAADVAAVRAGLLDVNGELWDIEDAIRDCERAGDFGPRFIELARAVYRTNDRRADLKRDINRLLASGIVEEKSYKPY